jgi:small subunit ribosomal protein S6
VAVEGRGENQTPCSRYGPSGPKGALRRRDGAQIQKEDQTAVNNRVYEILFIADPTLGEEAVDALTEQVQGFVEKDGGKVEKVEKWGKKRLAYEVRGHREGYYVLIVAESDGPLVKEVERKMKVTDGVIRYLTVRVDEELRKAERRKARRTLSDEKRRSRTSASTSSQPEGVRS